MKRLVLLLAILNLAYFLWWRSHPAPAVPPAAAPALPAALARLRLAEEAPSRTVSAAPSGKTAQAAPTAPLPAESGVQAPKAPEEAAVPLAASPSGPSGRGPSPDDGTLPSLAETAAKRVPPSRDVSRAQAPAGAPPPEGAQAQAPDSPMQRAAGVRDAPAAGKPVVDHCLFLGPFADKEEAAALAGRLAALGYRARLHSERVEAITGYWVFLPAESREEAEALLASVIARGLKDHYLDPRRRLVSLGIYTHRKMAERRRRQLEELGFAPRLEPRRRERVEHRLEVQATADSPPLDEARALAEGVEAEIASCTR